ncbi:hypothetical protein BDV34DRAFT_203322, partial [Aspergillus parasiticus]
MVNHTHSHYDALQLRKTQNRCMCYIQYPWIWPIGTAGGWERAGVKFFRTRVRNLIFPIHPNLVSVVRNCWQSRSINMAAAISLWVMQTSPWKSHLPAVCW